MDIDTYICTSRICHLRYYVQADEGHSIVVWSRTFYVFMLPVDAITLVAGVAHTSRLPAVYGVTASARASLLWSPFPSFFNRVQSEFALIMSAYTELYHAKCDTRNKM